MQPLDRRLSTLITLAILMLGIAILYWGRPVLMPLAVSILLTFLLNPVVDALHRRGLPQTPSVILVVLLVFSLFGAVIFGIGHQVTSLAEELPEYKDNIRRKILDFRTAGKGTALERIQGTIKDILGEIEKEDKASAEKHASEASSEAATKPVSVIVEGDKSTRRILPAAVGPVVELLASSGLVIVLVIFMLLRHQGLRNRLIGLVGHSRLSTTTKALDEAEARISRYLLMQTIVNATYGVATGIGLFFIGLPYALLWGFLAALARFIPYVGPWLGAMFPIFLSLAVFEGWMYPFLVIGLFLVLELATNMVLEPLLYGQSAGVSEVALLVAVAFWTWLWGPIGLALATPLTVCLVVLCKYIPELEFVEMLMGDEPIIDTRVIYYQRLLAMDQDEATEVVHGYLKDHTLDQVVDEVFIPALAFAKRDASREKLSAEDQRFIFQATRELAENLEPSQSSSPLDSSPSIQNSISKPAPPKIHILGCPARDEADKTALVLLRRLLDPNSTAMEVASSGLLSSEVISQVMQTKSTILCIGGLPPNAFTPARYLCKRLREAFPDLKIVVGRWGLPGESKEQRDLLLGAGADYVASTLLEARNQITQLTQILSQKEVSTSLDSSEKPEYAPAPSVLPV